MAARPWRVLYRTCAGQTSRSRSFTQEAAAVEWAQHYVAGHGTRAEAFVYHRAMDRDRDRESVSARYWVMWRGPEVGMFSWPAAGRSTASGRPGLEPYGVYLDPQWVRAELPPPP
jgi:hypothetical protein